MSELIRSACIQTKIRKQLLITASALTLTTYVTSAQSGYAEEADRPTVWIELGGQMDQIVGGWALFSAPFMDLIPTPGPYHDDIFQNGQKPQRRAFGFEGSISFRPNNADWIFEAAAKFGRSNGSRQLHNQTLPTVGPGVIANYAAAYADITSENNESHAILDFSAGKDVGLGAFNRDVHSVISGGVRFAQFSSKSKVDAYARPTVIPYAAFGIVVIPSFSDYAINAQAQRSFHGIGPSVSWDVSARLFGDHESGELTLDWGINGALLFGRQKVVLDHETQASHRPGTKYGGYSVSSLYDMPHHAARSRSVEVPNLGGFAGFSVKYPSAKVSLGYRADFFFGAVDDGIDARHTRSVSFHGPFATISIGLP